MQAETTKSYATILHLLSTGKTRTLEQSSLPRSADLVARKNIKIAKFDQDGEQLYDRINGKDQDGDCKLVAYPGDAKFPDYGLTLNGLPSAFACGLTGAINVGGTAIPLDPGKPDAAPAETASGGDQSTDGHGGAYVAPPEKKPFDPLTQDDYLCIFKMGDPTFCLPPGTYKSQGGFDFDIKDVDSLTVPKQPGWSLDVHWEVQVQSGTSWVGPQLSSGPAVTENNYKDPIDVNRDKDESSALMHNLAGVAGEEGSESWIKVNAPDDGPKPVCCLFSEPSFGGNVWCVGVGGGETLPQWKDVPQSVSCHGGGNVWLYAKEYGDTAGALIRGNVEDLKEQPFGNEGSFSKNLKALWVLQG